MLAVHQFLPTFEPGAIGTDALLIRAALRNAGYESGIFAEHIRDELSSQAHVHTAYGRSIKANSDDLLIYHMAIGSNVADFLMDRRERLMMRYHNITPVEYYEPWDPSSTHGMVWGRDQLRRMSKRVDISAGVSQYNVRELESLHYSNTVVTPVLLDIDAMSHAVDQQALEKLRSTKADGGVDWLFVGWIAPHKCQHDIIKAFAAYRRIYEPHARLHLVGRTGSVAYRDACEKLIAELGLAEFVHLHDRVSDGELGAFYAMCDVLVSMSEHEGVGLPLLEAMRNNLPIVAYSAAAIPETVGDAAILLPRKIPTQVAAAVNRVVSDSELRNALIARGYKRSNQFALPNATEQLLRSVEAD